MVLKEDYTKKKSLPFYPDWKPIWDTKTGLFTIGDWKRLVWRKSNGTR